MSNYQGFEYEEFNDKFPEDKPIYNKTQLSPDKTFERHVFHRDQFAHYLRWTHVLKISKIGNTILDVGCGSGNLAEVLYRNKHSCMKYLGIDIRERTINIAKEKFKNVQWIEFNYSDIITNPLPSIAVENNPWDIIACFEVIEHVGKQNVDKLMQNIANASGKNTIILFSTPCYNEHVGAADNHTYNGQINELTYFEMKEHLKKYFIIDNHWGTFASQSHYKQYMVEWQKIFYDKISEYYDSNLISNIMAPLFPQHSRNVLWSCRIK